MWEPFVSELLATCAYQFFKSAPWSSRHSSDLARSVSRRVAGVRCCPRRRWRSGRGGCSGARMLVRRWWIWRYSPSSLMGCGVSWSKTAWGRPPVDVPQRHVPRCLQQACSSTHKASLAMVLFCILQWWRLGVSSCIRLGGTGVGRRPLATVVAGNPRDRFVVLDLLGFYLQFQDNHFISFCLLVSICVVLCNLIFN